MPISEPAGRASRLGVARVGMALRHAASIAILLAASFPLSARAVTPSEALPSFPALPESSGIEMYSNRALPMMVRALGVDDPAVPYVVGADSRYRVEAQPIDADMSFVRVALTWPCPGLTGAAFAPRPYATGRPATFDVTRVPPSVIDDVLRAARNTAMDPAVMMAIAEVESNFSPSVKARASSAAGLYQFLAQSWLQAIKTYGARHGHGEEARALAAGLDASAPAQEKLQQILDLRHDPYLSAALAGETLARDSAHVARMIRRRLTPGETYMIHFLGVGDATRLLWAASVAPYYSAVALFPRPAQSNPGIFYERRYGMFRERSVVGVYALLENMMSWRANRYRRLATRPVQRVAINAQ